MTIYDNESEADEAVIYYLNAITVDNKFSLSTPGGKPILNDNLKIKGFEHYK
jgi:hypothetical protein